MIHFRFEVDEEQGWSASTLGHVHVEGPSGAKRSTEGGGMSMVVIAATDLLSMLTRLLSEQDGEGELVFADSSFTIEMRADPRGFTVEGAGTMGFEDAWEAAERDVAGFLSKAVNHLETGDPSRGDAIVVLGAFQRAKSSRTA